MRRGLPDELRPPPHSGEFHPAGQRLPQAFAAASRNAQPKRRACPADLGPGADSSPSGGRTDSPTFGRWRSPAFPATAPAAPPPSQAAPSGGP